jgi:Inner membrane protein YgaP-like, transmembrane domain
MKANVGGVDKILRIVGGLVLLSLILILDGNARWWGLVGLVPLLTGLINFCPIYTLIGLNTSAKKG